MNIKNLRAGVAITAAAALFAGLAENAQAIPMTARHPRVAPALNLSSPAQFRPASSGAALSTTTVQTRSSVTRRGHGPRITPDTGSIVLTPGLPVDNTGAFPITIPPVFGNAITFIPSAHRPVMSNSVPTTQAGTSVPDGGSTAFLMAGSFLGLALLRKKLKTSSGVLIQF